MMLFRPMKADLDCFPLTGASRRTLGVKPGEPPDGDIPIDEGNRVRPNTGGMSVTADDPRRLPKHRLPRTMGGEGRDPLFEISRHALPTLLAVRADQPSPSLHRLVEPATRSDFDDYQKLLYDTRASWRKLETWTPGPDTSAFGRN
jgi:hypothetical protein